MGLEHFPSYWFQYLIRFFNALRVPEGGGLAPSSLCPRWLVTSPVCYHGKLIIVLLLMVFSIEIA